MTNRLSRRGIAGLTATGLAATAFIGSARAQPANESTFDRVNRTKVLRIAALPGELPYFHKDIATGEWSGGSTWTHVRGEAKAAPGVWADSIDLWCDPQTGAAVRIALAWKNRGAHMPPRRLVLQQTPHDPWPADWFRHATHHAHDRAVTRTD